MKKLLMIGLCVASLTACQTTDGQNNTFSQKNIGTVLGAVGGALLGSQVGGGKGQLVGVAVGTLGGAWLGGSIGQSMDDVDRMKAEQAANEAFETAPDNKAVAWENPNTQNSGTITPIKTTMVSGQPCREYSSTVTIDGQLETVTGQACRKPDGTWQILN